MSINYHDRKFIAVSNSETGEVSSSTTFHYRQNGNILWATYSGGSIAFGTITGVVKDDGQLEFNYQHVNKDGQRKAGECFSKPELLPGGKLRMHESWQWTTGEQYRGESIVQEI